MQNIISLDIKKLARRGFQHGEPPPPHTGEMDPAPPRFRRLWILKTPSHRLIRSQYRGIVWAKEEGSWRDLEIYVSPKVEGWRPPSSAPLESGGVSAPLAPLSLYLCTRWSVLYSLVTRAPCSGSCFLPKTHPNMARRTSRFPTAYSNGLLSDLPKDKVTAAQYITLLTGQLHSCV